MKLFYEIIVAILKIKLKHFCTFRYFEKIFQHILISYTRNSIEK